MKHGTKMTVTLAMLWIGAMGLASTPAWIRAARDFVSKSTGHAAAPVASKNPGGTRTGRVGGSI
ncbi:MAG: hypothetical protein NUW01_18565 [Gemmatimonadaceae bacterium]|nr:hypothetical protein [Gemmatimonadaceae bacterium]